MKDGLDDIDDILTELDAYVRDEEERKKQRPDATASSSDPVLAPGGRKGSALQIALQQVATNPMCNVLLPAGASLSAVQSG